MRRFFAFVFLFFLSISVLFAGDWYVCVGSFAKIGNAEKVYDSLCDADLPALIYRHTQADGSSLYRVLLDRSFTKRDEARAYISEVEKNPFIIKSGIKGIWIVEVFANNFVTVVDRANATSQSAKSPQKKTTATKNQTKQKSTSQQTSTKENQAAEKQQPKIAPNQAQDDSQGSPIVYDAPFDTEKKTESQQNHQADSTLETTESEFEEAENPRIEDGETENSDEKEDFEASGRETSDDGFTEKNESETENADDETDETVNESEETSEYGDLIDDKSESEISGIDEKSEEPVARINSTDLPPTITGSAKFCIQQLPVNKDFDVVEAYICDFEKSRKSEFEYDSSEFPELLTEYILEEQINSVALVTYHGKTPENEIDDKKAIQVFVVASSPDEADIMNIFADSLDNAVQMATGNFAVSYGEIKYTLFKAGEVYCLYGSTDDNVVTVAMKAIGFGIVDVLSFLNNFYIGESLSIYPQIEETLFNRSDNANAGQEFVCFCMKEYGARIYFVNAD